MFETEAFYSFFKDVSSLIIGVGNPDRGDDGIGSLLAKKLIDAGFTNVVDCEDVPENFTGEIKNKAPQKIIFLDALDFQGEAGDLILLNSDELATDRFNSHRPSLGLVANYLKKETGAEIYVLGIQPETIGLEEKLSPKVEKTLNLLYDLFKRVKKEA